MPPVADQAQILRSIQRDKDAIRQLEDDIKEVISDILPNKIAISSYIRNLHAAIAQLCYYNYTTLSGNQTLGEEYVGIVLARPDLLPPSGIHLLSMVMLRILGPHMLSYMLTLWERSLKDSNRVKNEEEMLQSARNIFILKEAFSILQSARNGIFYLTGSLYDMAMWVTGIKYVLIRSWLRDEKVSHYFRLLGIITLVHTVVGASEKWWKLQKISGEEFKSDSVAESSESGMNYCYLCMEKRKNTSATPCGHLFCWNCIIDAVRVKNVCPLCREKVIPSRIVILKNYD